MSLQDGMLLYHSQDDIPWYNFETTDKNWLWFVSMNRRSQLAGKFRKVIDTELLKAEIIVGKIANDTTNPTIMTYLNGLFGNIESEEAVNFAIGRLLPNRLKNQYCFLSERAVNGSSFLCPVLEKTSQPFFFHNAIFHLSLSLR